MGHRAGRVRHAVVWLILGGAIVYLAWWGVLRGLAASGDLAVGYGAGAAWLHGSDPYAVSVIEAELRAAGADDTTVSELLNVYFPTTLPSFVPLVPLSWQMAKVAFVALNVALTAFIAWGLLRLLHWPWSDLRSLLLVAFVLALAPLHTTIAIGQGAIVSTAAVVAAIVAERAGRPAWSGLFYGLAIVFKVQIGLPFLAYAAWRRRWTTFGAASALVAVVTAVSIGRMALAGVPWLASWTANLAVLSGPGGINDPSPLNPARYSLINLQYLLGTFGIIGIPADLITYAIVGAAALGMVRLVRGQDRHQELLILSSVAVLGLLVTYHRYYDAVLLVLPIAWAMSTWGTDRTVSAIVLVLCADFLFPFQTALHELGQRLALPDALVSSPLWSSILATQHVWALVFLVAALLWAAYRQTRPPQRSSVT